MAGNITLHPELGLHVVGYVENAGESAAPPEDGKLLGPLTSLEQVVGEVKPDRIVVGFAERRGQMPIADLLKLRYGGMTIDEASAAYEQLCGRVMLSELRPPELRLSGHYRPPSQRLLYQTVADWVFALLLAILSAPLLVLAVILLRLSHSGPLLSRQECAGLGGKPFQLYGLRLGA